MLQLPAASAMIAVEIFSDFISFKMGRYIKQKSHDIFKNQLITQVVFTIVRTVIFRFFPNRLVQLRDPTWGVLGSNVKTPASKKVENVCSTQRNGYK